MTAITPPPLRRSKRKLDTQAANPVANTITTDDTPVPRKRARRAISATTASSSVDASASEERGRGQDNEPVPSLSQHHTLPPFLALPRELRDEVYKHVLATDDSSTLKSGSRNIITHCGLAGVNRQICEEYLDAVLFHAPVITATVRNHNFAPVVTFLNRLSQAQLNRLSHHEAPVADTDDDDTRPKRRIRIILSYSAGAKDSRAHLNRWLDRFDNPDKRGKEIEFEYEGDGKTYNNGGYKQRPRGRAYASRRWNDEADKIAEAAAKGKSSWRSGCGCSNCSR